MRKLLLQINKNKKTLAFSVILVTLVAAALIIHSAEAYEVRIDNKFVGIVKKQSTVQNIVNDLSATAKSGYGTETLVSSRIKYNKVFLAGKSVTDQASLRNQVKKNLKLQLKAFAINVNGKDIAYLKDCSSAREVLDQIKAPYIKSGKDSADVGFLENVSISERPVAADKLETTREVYDKIVKRSLQTRKYTVQKGDTVSAISVRFGVKTKEISKANPGIDIDSISEGKELNLAVPRYMINVRISTIKSYSRAVPYEILYHKSKTLYKGNSKIKVKGTEGRKQVKVELVSINGIPDTTRTVNENITAAPKSQIVLTGTKERPRTLAYGVFIRPSRGSLTSRFGERWSRKHTGIDIGVPRGTPNRAADGGVVIFAGRDGTYGKLVIIDHENGFTTYYAHNNTIKVKRGQRVARGDVIGTAGSTGRATGPHLHFEIRKNGVPVNPLKYIK